MKRTNTYLGTFTNSEEGISSYKLMVKTIRQTVKGGKFVKMFRGGKRRKTYYGSAGCSVKEGSTHFDCYLNGQPTFYGFKLVPHWK